MHFLQVACHFSGRQASKIFPFSYESRFGVSFPPKKWRSFDENASCSEIGEEKTTTGVGVRGRG
jgi:hypothetical protein